MNEELSGQYEEMTQTMETDNNIDLEKGFQDDKDKKPGGSGTKGKRTVMACIRCRGRHIRCPGGNPCKKCQLAKTKCEYVEADKRLVVSMKYLSKLHDDIARLKKENAALKSNRKDNEGTKASNSSTPPSNSFTFNSRPSSQPISLFNENSSAAPATTGGTEVIHPTLDKYGRLIHNKTGERIYVGSSSMTLFGLEIQNMAPYNATTPLLASPGVNSVGGYSPSPSDDNKRETEVLEKEGNAYQIVLAKTNTRPGLSMNFTLPAYSYAMLLVDNFVNYNDGCFYFFNEGLVKQYLMNLYAGKTEENKKIIKRNINNYRRYDIDENTIKQDRDDDTILETMWFCKILLIFAVGEMYLGTESDVHVKKVRPVYTPASRSSKHNNKSNDNDNNNNNNNNNNNDNTNNSNNNSQNQNETPPNNDFPGNTLPGSGFFYQASELFTGLFASGAIDNITKDGGIEVMLLYAFYLQVADCTIASYFYFGLALRAALILGWHVDSEKNSLDRFELEHRRRIWWTVYMYERMLSSKAGLPLSFADDSVSTELPKDLDMKLPDFPRDKDDVRGYFIFPSAEYINNCVTITQINAIILSSLYTKQPTVNILPAVSDLVHRLMAWKNQLPDFLRIDYATDNLQVSRLIVNLMTEYFQGINLAVRPLLFHFATKKLKELQLHDSSNKYVDLTRYSKNILTLLNASFQASINTVRSIWALLPENMVALFGWMDREYLFTSALTLILFNSSFGLHDATKEHLDHALIIFTKMKKLGNYPAALRRAQLLRLISVLDFNGVMRDLLVKHDDEGIYIKPDSSSSIHMASNFSNDHKKASGKTDSQLHHNQEPQEFANYNFNNLDYSDLSQVYTQHDEAGIEGFAYLPEEHKLWNEITNDAVWLNPSSHKDTGGGSEQSTGPNNEDLNEILGSLGPKSEQSPNLGAYTDIINEEFQDLMQQ